MSGPAEDPLERYVRQIGLLGIEGQEKLESARVLVAGVGGIGCFAALYLASAGVGRLMLVDAGKVAASDLNRQVLYSEEDISKPKAKVAEERLRDLNPHIRVEGVEGKVEDLAELVKEADLVLDCLDNWGARFALNKACVEHGVPLIHAGANGFYAQLMVVIPGETPCLNCVFGGRVAKTGGPLPAIVTTVALIASIQVQEAVKLLTGRESPLTGRLLLYNGVSCTIELVRVARRKDCEVCGGSR